MKRHWHSEKSCWTHQYITPIEQYSHAHTYGASSQFLADTQRTPNQNHPQPQTHTFAHTNIQNTYSHYIIAQSHVNENDFERMKRNEMGLGHTENPLESRSEWKNYGYWISFDLLINAFQHNLTYVLSFYLFHSSSPYLIFAPVFSVNSLFSFISQSKWLVVSTAAAAAKHFKLVAHRFWWAFVCSRIGNLRRYDLISTRGLYCQLNCPLQFACECEYFPFNVDRRCIAYIRASKRKWRTFYILWNGRWYRFGRCSVEVKWGNDGNRLFPSLSECRTSSLFIYQVFVDFVMAS